MTEPTRVVQLQITDGEGIEVVPVAGTTYRMSDDAGNYTDDLVLVCITQEQYNRVQGILQMEPDETREYWGPGCGPGCGC